MRFEDMSSTQGRHWFGAAGDRWAVDPEQRPGPQVADGELGSWEWPCMRPGGGVLGVPQLR